MRRLCLPAAEDEDATRLDDAVKALRRRGDVAADQVNHSRCLESLAAMVAKHHNEDEASDHCSLLCAQFS